MSTPAGVTISATNPDGTTLDVTEGVQVLYDLVISSMDWGSGFLGVEDVEPIVAIAEFCGFKESEQPAKYIENERKAQRQRECKHPYWTKEPPDALRGAVFAVCTTCELRRFVPS